MIICAIFSLVYLFSFCVEILSLRTRSATWVILEIWLLGVGLLFQTLFLGTRINESARSPLSSPQDALLVLVWVLVSISIGMISTHRRKNFGIFFLPMILILLGIAYFATSTPFALRPASVLWGTVHGISMLLAASSIFCGVLSGTLYLRQVWKLKHPGKVTSSFRLPSLEWLHYANRHSMKFATTMLALGVLSGIVLNLQRGTVENLLVNWMILGTSSLLFWFVFSLILGFFWKRANAGPQIAYRTILNFVALCTLFGLVIFSQHRIMPTTTQIIQPPTENTEKLESYVGDETSKPLETEELR